MNQYEPDSCFLGWIYYTIFKTKIFIIEESNFKHSLNKKLMKQDFDNYLMSLLEEYENNPEQNIDELIEKKCREWDVTNEQFTLIKECNTLIDDFTEKAISLDKAKADGWSRKRWMLNEMDRITDGRSEEEKAQIASAISDTNEKVIEETTAKE